MAGQPHPPPLEVPSQTGGQSMYSRTFGNNQQRQQSYPPPPLHPQHPLHHQQLSARYTPPPAAAPQSGSARQIGAQYSQSESPDSYTSPQNNAGGANGSDPSRKNGNASASTSAATTATAGSSSGVAAKRGRPKAATSQTGAGAAGSDDEDGEGEHGDRKKRNRLALSCGECKRRKIKCDRKVPCIACIKRGRPETCSWEDARIEPEPQVFALATDLKLLAGRLAQVEAFLSTLPPELQATLPAARPLLLGNPGLTLPPPASEPTPVEVDESDDIGSDTEAAASALEAAAFASHRGPQSIPSLRPWESTTFSTSRPIPTNTNEARMAAMELTSQGTSILAEPLKLDGGITSSQLGLEWGIPDEDIPRARLAALEQVHGCLLQDPDMSRTLVEIYFTDCDWIHGVIRKASFVAEHERYLEMRQQGRLLAVDPAWLAVYCMVLAIALDGVTSQPKGDGTQFAGMRPSAWYSAAQRFLQLADWQGTPQIRTIITIILFGVWIQGSSNPNQSNKFLSWLGLAIRLSQLLGLQSLGSDPETMPADDPAWPVGKNSVKREGALRLFGVLRFLDSTFAANARFPAYMLHSSQYNTAILSNLNDDDLSITEWKVNPLPRNVATDSSFEHIKVMMAERGRESFDKLLCDTSHFSYQTVLDLDKSYRELLAKVPEVWRSEHAKLEASNPKLRWCRNIVQQSVHSRIFRLHRPFLSKGYAEGSRYRFSTEQCIASARIVISSHHNILQRTTNTWFIYTHSLGAAIVLFADLFHAVDSGLSVREVEIKKEVLVWAFEVFGSHAMVPSPPLRRVVQAGGKVLSGLFMELEMRSLKKAAANDSPLSTDQPAPETFAQVLTRITRDLLQRPAPATSNPSTAPSTSNLAATNPSTAVPNAAAPPPDLRALPQDIIFPQEGASAVPFEQQLNQQFLFDLGLPTGTGGLNFWAPEGADGFTPPHFPFPPTTDFGNPGMQPNDANFVGDPNALAAGALLDQLQWPPW